MDIAGTRLALGLFRQRTKYDGRPSGIKEKIGAYFASRACTRELAARLRSIGTQPTSRKAMSSLRDNYRRSPPDNTEAIEALSRKSVRYLDPVRG